MNYIFSEINKKINFLKSASMDNELRIYYQSKFELYLIFILGYLWSKNLSKVGLTEREEIANKILKPSIGTIIQLIRILDIDGEFFGKGKLKKFTEAINRYPHFRNEKIGHGYSYEDDVTEYLKFFEEIFNLIENNEDKHQIFSNVDIIKVLRKNDNSFNGILFKPNGTYINWSCVEEVNSFEIFNIYIFSDHLGYFKISPFICIENEDEFYSYCSIEEKLIGRTKYNKLLKTGSLFKEVHEFEKLLISSDNHKKKSINGTIINNFNNNFKKYIDVGITKKIINFLKGNKSSVFATIWGHGGVGKTASIQRVCEILCNEQTKTFDYIVFLSAKDRFYNYYQGKIYSINMQISSLEDILLKINSIIFEKEDYGKDEILNYEGNLLIIIDDFETFTKEEKLKIMSFVKELDINHHKVILTTRSATLITGEEIQTKELNEDETIVFLKEAVKNEVPIYNINSLELELKNPELCKKVFTITSGRPLFILQLAIYIGQKGSLSDAITKNINSTKEAIDFLYDRIYDYLSISAKNMFLAISLLIEENDLSGLLSNLKFILNKEEDDDSFTNSLNELIKLKIITIDKDFFKVYSPEIYKLMKIYYMNKGEEYDGNITSRFNLINSNDADSTEAALLENANASRHLETEVEVENKYRYILNRTKTPFKFKKEALLNYATYLITKKTNIEKALKLFQDYFQTFKWDFDFIEAYSKCSWASAEEESKDYAVQILTNFLATRPKLDTEKYLSILGLLMTFKSILIVSEREEIKYKYKFDEIEKETFNMIRLEQSERFKEIYDYPGKKLYSTIKDCDLMTLSPSCRNIVLDGLTHFVEISIRRNNISLAKEICEKIFSEMPHNYQIPFKHKMKKISLINEKNHEYKEKNNKMILENTDTLSKLTNVFNNRF